MGPGSNRGGGCRPLPTPDTRRHHPVNPAGWGEWGAAVWGSACGARGDGGWRKAGEEEEEERWRRGREPFPSRAEPSRAEPLPTVIPRSEQAAPQALCQASPVLNRKLRIYRGRRKRRGEERSGGGGGWEPGGAGRGRAAGRSRGSPGGSVEPEEPPAWPQAAAALRSRCLCSGCGRCLAKGRSPRPSRGATRTNGRRRGGVGHGGGEEGGPPLRGRRKGVCEPGAGWGGDGGFAPAPPLPAAGDARRHLRCVPPTGSTPRGEMQPPPITTTSPGATTGEDEAAPPQFLPLVRGMRGWKPRGINSLGLINNCLKPS